MNMQKEGKMKNKLQIALTALFGVSAFCLSFGFLFLAVRSPCTHRRT